MAGGGSGSRRGQPCYSMSALTGTVLGSQEPLYNKGTRFPRIHLFKETPKKGEKGTTGDTEFVMPKSATIIGMDIEATDRPSSSLSLWQARSKP